MSFYDIVRNIDISRLSDKIYCSSYQDVEIALNKDALNENDLAALLSPAARKYLEPMALKSREITLRRFGKTIKLYAPLYVSNACVNSCVYCGFNRKNEIPRINLTVKEIEKEAAIISKMGIKNVILVSGDNQKAFSDDELINAVKVSSKYFPFVAVEVRALDENVYSELHEAGADGFTMFQETYLEDKFPAYHPAGPKADYRYRLEAPERAAKARMRSVGLGALLGLEDFRLEIYLMCLHAAYLADKYWQSHISASFPRIRAAAGGYVPSRQVSDGELMQSIFAFRLFLNDAGINISTREKANLRDKLMLFGATIMSAGSKTEPGGYAHAREEAGQFLIDDGRSVKDFVAAVIKAGYDPVMKDWDGALREQKVKNI